MIDVMGILNVTPDSFSDGGHFFDPAQAIAHGRALFEQGAALVDVGGESARPGAVAVEPAEERARVVPVVRALTAYGRVSIDTRRASVAQAALEAGATLVNDVSGGADPEMFDVVAASGCDIVLMHMRGTPDHMQRLADYGDVCAEVWGALAARRTAAVAAGVRPENILLDPGIGLPKNLAHNLALLRDLPARTKGCRVLLGASRKAFIGALTGQAVAADRVEGSIAVALHAADAGVAMVRVHDVAATVRALTVWNALRTAS